MTHVQGFDNMDDMFAAMQAAEDAANDRLTPGQTRLRDATGEDHYWAQPAPDLDLVIFGSTPSLDALRKVISVDFDLDDNRRRGYLTGTAYSAATPDGEGGDTHVSQVVPISKATFDLAHDLGWPDWSRMLSDPECQPLGRALAKAEEEARR